MSKALIPKRGEVWMIDFDPATGPEIRKIRPAVIINLDSIGRLPLRIVVPITDWRDAYMNYPWFVRIPASAQNGLIKDSGADAFQTKSVSETRLVRRLGELTHDQVEEVANAIALCVGAP